MAVIGFPERAQTQKLVSEMAERLGATFTITSAKEILGMQIPGFSPERQRELADKANEGTLSAEEFADYETYAQIRGLLAILQSKARLFLQQAGAG